MSRSLSRRTLLTAAAGTATAACLSVVPRRLAAQDVTYFRIATASAGGTYFPIGGLIANAISNPPGSRPCDRGGSCGVPGVIAVAQSTQGSVQNVELINAGLIESGLSQADIAYWAYTGSGLFAETGPFTNLRSIANLYPESVHVVVRRGAGITSMADLRGRRVSIDRLGSGTRADALLILEAYGLGKGDYEAVSEGASVAAQMLREGEIDAFIFVAGTPATVVTGLAYESLIALLPLEGPVAEELRRRQPFLAADTIASATYNNVAFTPTLSVGAQWLIGAQVPEELVYQLTQALWHENSRKLLDGGHPKGALIRLETALNGLGAPLHRGAVRYYAERGLPVPDSFLPGGPLKTQ